MKATHTQCGKCISALLILCLSSFPLQASEWEAVVESYLTPKLTEAAKRQQLSVTRISYQHQLPDAPLRCANPRIEHELTDVFARQRLTLRCKEPKWQTLVLTQATLWTPAIYAAHNLERGSVIGADDIQRGELALTRNTRAFYSTPDQVIGLEAKRRIRASQLLSANLTQSATLIRRGQQVTIMASQHGITASTQGEALSDGTQGEVIRVRNLKSEKVIEAKIIGAGEVTSLY